MRFVFNDSAMHSFLTEIFQEKLNFRTSADVVIKVSSLRYEAICAIAREQGIIIENIGSRCIDENLLSRLADAHVRQLRSWFNNSIRHLQELSGAEPQTLADFCNSFKKHQSDKRTKLSWNAIDTDKLRKQFIKKVHDLTPTPLEDIFPLAGHFSIGFSDSPRIKEYTIAEALQEQQDKAIMQAVNSRLFRMKPIAEAIPSDSDKREKTRQVTLCARYHIFSDSGEEFHIAS